MLNVNPCMGATMLQFFYSGLDLTAHEQRSLIARCLLTT